MARLESVAVGGYYKLPTHLIPLLAGVIEVVGQEVPEVSADLDYPGYKPAANTAHVMFDPCAGDGEAIYGLRDALFNERMRRPEVYAVEMERTRYGALRTRVLADQNHYQVDRLCLHGDAFNVVFNMGHGKKGANSLYLNPPYDTDKEHGRLEERFLVRFTSALCNRGLLVFVVPFYALKASAETLAKHYRHLSCVRFPDADFAGYKQVFLFAEKHGGHEVPDPAIYAQVMAWAQNAESIPVLGPDTPCLGRMSPMGTSEAGFQSLTVEPIDVARFLAAYTPWKATDRGGKLTTIQGIVPEGSIESLLDRKYPLAMPPRPAHIATGVAAGIFNGAVIKADKPDAGISDLLVKGCFDREWHKESDKTNKDGEITGKIEVQQPKLVVTVFDLEKKSYHTLQASPTVTWETDPAKMTTADLLAHYGTSLMDVMLQQCPVLHDPAHDTDRFPMPNLPRRLYPAQEEAARATIKLLGGPGRKSRAKRQGKSAFVLGEIGSGKSTVAGATAVSIAANKVLIMCPPHLLPGWAEQIAAFAPWARVVVLNDVDDVRLFCETPDIGPWGGLQFAILSREVAKLGTAHQGVEGRCGHCHTPVPDGDLGKKRARCEGTTRTPVDAYSRFARDLALACYPAAPDHHSLQQILNTPILRRRMAQVSLKSTEESRAAAFKRAQSRPVVEACMQHLFGVMQTRPSDAVGELDLMRHLCLAAPSRAARVAEGLYAWAMGQDPKAYGAMGDVRQLAVELLLLVPGEDRVAVIERMKSTGTELPGNTYRTTAPDRFGQLEQALTSLSKGERGGSGMDYAEGSQAWGEWKMEAGKLYWGRVPVGQPGAMIEAVEKLSRAGTWTRSKVCNEPLFQVVPDPTRRVPLATYIARHYPRAFDLLILDEGHEYASEGSAQSHAAHRLTALGIPVLLLSGTIMNGYAASLFVNTWALIRKFREEFERAEMQRFVDRYGYRKRLVQDKDKETGKIVAFGSHTDRTERSERMAGNAPGVLPLFVLAYMLAQAVTLQKSDLETAIPPMVEERVLITPTKEQMGGYTLLKDKIIAQMRADQFKEDYAGALFGALSELPSCLDRATNDTGNQDASQGGAYQVRYPDSLGGGLIVEVPGLPANTILPKEQWMLDQLRADLDAGENVLILSWHTTLLPRYQRLIEQRMAIEAPLMDSGKVSTGKREAWIKREILGKNRRVMLVNPKAISTGINSLIHFSRIIMMENPACDPTIYRQVIGRIHRIGQLRNTKVYSPVYANTLQEQLYKLLMHKVGVSQSTDGLDNESALRAAGVGSEGSFSGMSVGKQLYELITTGRETPQARVVRKPAVALTLSF